MSQDTASRPARLGIPSWRSLGPVLLAAAGLFAYWRLLEYDPSIGVRNDVPGAEGFFFSPTGSYPGLLLVLSLWLTYRRRKRLSLAMQIPTGAWAPVLGALLVSVASGAAIWAHYVDNLALLVPSASMMILGGSLILGGVAGGRAMLVPSLFLLLAFPAPPVLHNQIIWPMQLATTQITTDVLDLFGMSAMQSGDLIVVRGDRLYQVIESCAGLRSIETLLMSAFVYAEIFHRRGLRAALLVAVAPALGLLINQVRVLTIVINPWSDVGPVHTTQGVAMLVMGVLAIALLDGALGRLLPPRFDPRWQRPKAAAEGVLARPAAWRAIALFYLLLVLGAVITWMPRWQVEMPRYRPLYSLRPTLGDWRGLGLDLDDRFLGSVGYSEWVHRRYNSRGVSADVFVGGDTRLEQRMSLISPKNEIPGIGYTLLGRKTIVIEPGGPPTERAIIRRGGQIYATFTWYEEVGPLHEEILRSALTLDRGPLRRPERALVLRVTAELPPDQEAWGDLEDRLLELIRLVRRDVERLQG